jgi:glutaredoxin 3
MQRGAITSLRSPASCHFKIASKIASRSPTSRRSFAVRAGLNDVINNISVAIQNSPMAKGKAALAKLQAGQFDEEATGKKIDQLIASNAVMVFSFSSCPFCVKAKKILDDAGVKYTAVELNQMGAEGMAIRAVLAERTGRTSMPNIWVGGQGIGGCNDGPGIATLQRNGELTPLLQKAGAL